jgi:hypothetical protein
MDLSDSLEWISDVVLFVDAGKGTGLSESTCETFVIRIRQRQRGMVVRLIRTKLRHGGHSRGPISKVSAPCNECGVARVPLLIAVDRKAD